MSQVGKAATRWRATQWPTGAAGSRGPSSRPFARHSVCEDWPAFAGIRGGPAGPRIRGGGTHLRTVGALAAWPADWAPGWAYRLRAAGPGSASRPRRGWPKAGARTFQVVGEWPRRH